MRAKRASTTFKKGDRVKLAPGARREFQRMSKLLPADLARGLDDISRRIDRKGDVVRVEPCDNCPCPDRVIVKFPDYHRTLDCSPKDLEKA